MKRPGAQVRARKGYWALYERGNGPCARAAEGRSRSALRQGARRHRSAEPRARRPHLDRHQPRGERQDERHAGVGAGHARARRSPRVAGGRFRDCAGRRRVLPGQGRRRFDRPAGVRRGNRRRRHGLGRHGRRRGQQRRRRGDRQLGPAHEFRHRWDGDQFRARLAARAPVGASGVAGTTGTRRPSHVRGGARGRCR